MEGQLIENNFKPRKNWQDFFKERKNRLIVLVSILGLLIVIGVGQIIYNRYLAPTEISIETNKQSSLPSINTSEPTAKPTTTASTLDGTQVDNVLATRRPLAVMVENHPDARPQAGLASAANVWETMTEGGITRFLAIFGPHDAEKIGPVRSARPYFIAWASGYNALYAHAGGSQAALALLSKTQDVVDLPHSGSYFHREPKAGIASEHTLFTSSKNLYDYAISKKVSTDTQNFTPFKFKDDEVIDKRPAKASITIKFSSASYDVKWEYDKEKNVYKRILAGSAHKDQNTNKQIIAKNIVTLNIERRYDPNTNQGKGEWFMTTEGEGDAQLYIDGQKIDARWKKPSINRMLKIYNRTTGDELSFNKGQIWFEITPADVSVSNE